MINMEEIKICKKKSINMISFFFFKNDYLLCHIVETKNIFVFTEYYDEVEFKNYYSHINNYSNYIQRIELYEFLFSEDINRLFFNRTKFMSYKGDMHYCSIIERELKEYFKNIIGKDN